MKDLGLTVSASQINGDLTGIFLKLTSLVDSEVVILACSNKQKSTLNASEVLTLQYIRLTTAGL